MIPDVLAPYTQNIAQGKKNDSRINAVYSGGQYGTVQYSSVQYSTVQYIT